jgi:hypothetical protein
MFGRRRFAIGVALGLFAGVTSLASTAAAVDLTLTLDRDADAFAQQLGLDVPKLRTALEDELRRYYQLYRVGDFLKEFGDGQSFTNRGLGVDYASDFKLFMVGVAANLAFNRDSAFQQAASPFVDFGRGLNMTVMAGVNLEALGLGPISLYTNYFVLQHKIGAFQTRTSNFGLHLQAQFLKPEVGLVGYFISWGGFDLTTGVEQEKAVLELDGVASRVLPLDQLSPQAAGAQLKVDARGKIAFYTRSLTVPFEITTNVRLLSLLSLYGGVGYDVKVASSVDGYMDANTGLTGRVQTPNGRQDFKLGAAQIHVTNLERLNAGTFRTLAGVQLNLFLVKIFVHGNMLLRDPVLATVGGGVRFAF